MYKSIRNLFFTLKLFYSGLWLQYIWEHATEQLHVEYYLLEIPTLYCYTNTKTYNIMKKIKFYNPLNKVIAELEVTKEKYDALVEFGMIAEFEWDEVI